MKKSKFFKRAGLVALSAVLTAGIALTAAGCGGGGGGGKNDRDYRVGTPGRGTDPNVLTVYIFCNESDAATNRQICDDWMAKYNQAHGTNYSVDFVPNTDKGDYFDRLADYWSTNQMYDVIYLAPRYVRTYAETGSVLNIAEYLDKVAADPTLTDSAAITASNSQAFGSMWKNAISYYSYQKGASSTYTLGQPVSYKADQNGFYTDADNIEVGLYGLPKDYSNFSTGYNRLFFSQEMKEALTTTLATATRNVKGAKSETPASVSSERVYQANTGREDNAPGAKSIVQYAVSGTYTNPYTRETMTATEGADAPIINVGIPTRYKPFNFFRFNNYKEALNGGDPMALMCEAYTNGEGYTVTIPGFPNDTFKLASGTAVDADALYDTSIGHITYTYAEYSAFIWAMTYYLNTFDGQPFNGGEEDGFGGTSISGEPLVIFGGEQYEGVNGAAGSVLYLLPWLYGNDADLINAASTYSTSVKDGVAVDPTVAIGDPENWRDYVGNATNVVSKMNLDGTYRDAAVQYGYNSQNYIETYGAFLALGSDWNANNGGDSDSASETNGWGYFRAGRSLFYGAGSWDAATRNDTEPDVLEFGQMPTPVSEKYALYSKIKGANYTMETYSNGATSKGSGNDANNDSVQRSNLADGLKVYTQADIIANQTLRQDKWGARMDSVGYAVNGQVTNYEGAHAWKEEAAVSLVMALTIDRDAQVTLTYAGAQFPNFSDQMEQFVNYQTYGADGAFKDMLTPEGFSDMQYYNADGSVNATVAAQAKEIWDGYYALALQMQDLARQGSSQTVGQFLDGKTVAGAAVKYNAAYANSTFSSFVGSTTTSFLAYAMKTLNMVALWRDDREINLRMQYGLNAVRDSTMYTYNDLWIGAVDARDYTGTMFAYSGQKVLTTGSGANVRSLTAAELPGIVINDPSDSRSTWMTPVVFCLSRTATAQQRLNEAIQLENAALDRMR